MIARSPTFEETCARLFSTFFEKYPNSDLQNRAGQALAKLVRSKRSCPGKPEGWAAGIVYAAASIGVGVPGVLNRELEEAFGVHMSTIYERAAQLREWLDLYRGL